MLLKSLSGGKQTRFAGAITLLLATACFAETFSAHGQSPQDSATILVSEQLRVAAGAESPVRIEVTTRSATPHQLLLLIRGVPPTIALSHGRLFESGIWALRIGDLSKLNFLTQSDAAGDSQLWLSLVGVDGTVITQRNVRLVVAPGSGGPAPEDTAAANTPDRQTTASIPTEKPKAGPDLAVSLPPIGPKPLTAEATEEALQLMARGDDNLKTGKIIVARKFYERAAEQGWGPAAFALARTYDPQELAKIGVIGGIRPDLNLAKLWYGRARDLGLAEAGDRLEQISKL